MPHIINEFFSKKAGRLVTREEFTHLPSRLETEVRKHFPLTNDPLLNMATADEIIRRRD